MAQHPHGEIFSTDPITSTLTYRKLGALRQTYWFLSNAELDGAPLAIEIEAAHETHTAAPVSAMQSRVHPLYEIYN